MSDPRRVLIDSLKEKNRVLEQRAIAAEKEVIEKEFATRIRNTRIDLEYISESIDEEDGVNESHELHDQQQELSSRLKFYQDVSMKLIKLIDNKVDTLDGLKEKGFPDMDAMIESRLVDWSQNQKTIVTTTPVTNDLIDLSDHPVKPDSQEYADKIIKADDIINDDKDGQSDKSSISEDLYSPALDEDVDSRSNSPHNPRKPKVPGSSKTPCRFFAKGRCKDGDKCVFQHAVNEKRKTRICTNYLRGHCKRGDACDFAHGYTDLKNSFPRRQPPARVDIKVVGNYRPGPHPEPCNNQQCENRLTLLKHKTQMCRNVEKCQHRDQPAKCRFAHGHKELNPLPKAEVCERWLRHLCKFESDQCIYAHGEAELGKPRYSMR